MKTSKKKFILLFLITIAFLYSSCHMSFNIENAKIKLYMEGGGYSVYDINTKFALEAICEADAYYNRNGSIELNDYIYYKIDGDYLGPHDPFLIKYTEPFTLTEGTHTLIALVKNDTAHIKEYNLFKKENINVYKEVKIVNNFDIKSIVKAEIEKNGNNGNYNYIDVSKVSNFSELFKDMPKFNGDISQWDVSNAENMRKMFYGCFAFNCDISNWNTSKVKNVESMFDYCRTPYNTKKWEFRQNLSKWDSSGWTNINNFFVGPCDVGNYFYVLSHEEEKVYRPSMTLMKKNKSCMNYFRYNAFEKQQLI